jgi:hypothetical protein
MNFLRLVLLTVALLASTFAFSVHPPVATGKVSAHSLLGSCDTDVHVHAANDPAASPSLVAVPIGLSLPTQATGSLHLDTSNTTMIHKTSNVDAMTAALSGVATAALSGMMCAAILFGADVPPVHAVSTAQSLQNIEANQVEMTKALKELSANMKRLSEKVDGNQRGQLELSAKVDRNQQKLLDLSAKVDCNQQELLELSAKADRNQQELSLKIGQVDYKYIWIPIIVSVANIVLPRER